MPHPPKPTHVTVCHITTRCRRHGDHLLVMASLDNGAHYAAEMIVRQYEEAGFSPVHRTFRIPISQAQAAVFSEEGVNLDDLPF